jgi:hypothetical protein
VRTHWRLVTAALTALTLVGCARTPAGSVAGLSGVTSEPASAPASVSPPVSPAPAPGTIRDSTQINGALVLKGGRELSIDYVGGDCDLSASARADETSTAITVQVLVKDSGGMCEAIGYARTVNAPLNSPWAGRRIVDITGTTVATMDATQLLQPTWLPPAYVSEGIAQVGASDDNVDAGETWSVPSSVPSLGATSCKPSQDALSIREGVLGPQPPGYPTVPGTYVVNGRPATLQRANDPFDIGALTLSWTPPDRPSGWTITVSASPQCQGDLPLTSNTVLRFANGLR